MKAIQHTSIALMDGLELHGLYRYDLFVLFLVTIFSLLMIHSSHDDSISLPASIRVDG